MKYRFVEYQGDIYVVLGQGYDSRFDPPEILIGFPLQDGIHRSVVTNLSETIIPLFEAVEITDRKRVTTLLVLYGK